MFPQAKGSNKVQILMRKPFISFSGRGSSLSTDKKFELPRYDDEGATANPLLFRFREVDKNKFI